MHQLAARVRRSKGTRPLESRKTQLARRALGGQARAPAGPEEARHLGKTVPCSAGSAPQRWAELQDALALRLLVPARAEILEIETVIGNGSP